MQEGVVYFSLSLNGKKGFFPIFSPFSRMFPKSLLWLSKHGIVWQKAERKACSVSLCFKHIYRNSPKYSYILNFRTPIIFCKNNLFFVPNFGQRTLCVHIVLKMMQCWRKQTESCNSFPNKPWFLRVCSTSVLKTL